MAKIVNKWPRKVEVHGYEGHYWAKMKANKYPLGNCSIERGPYPYEWMAHLAFPIQRWTW